MANKGSPPHPRGILDGSLNLIFLLRFTPASAGNIRTELITDQIVKVHPRIRGEYVKYFKLVDGGVGSPPHPRGIL